MLQRVQRQISRHGFFSMLVVRAIPIAPFAVINFVAGANGFRLRDFILATIAGMTPGILTLVILEDQFQKLLRDRTVGRFALLLGLAIFFAGLAWAFYRWVTRRRVARALG
jgi:phospholipase D1/2